ncbi:MAG: endonuclease/exonuclease/phosphatase family protein [Terriglobales bacterium]
MIHKNIDAETAKGLKALRQRIEASKVPSSKLDESILVASWNIREFGRKKRTQKAIHYIAEVLSYFDLISVQEVRADLGDLGRVLELLPNYWRAVFSDVTEGSRGNEERIAYLYDKRAVVFTGLAAEAVAPPLEVKKDGKRETIAAAQFWRTPYIASFRAGTFDFVLISVHVLWGQVSADRAVELERIADWVEMRRTAKFVEDKDIILMGDFNIPKVNGPFYKAIAKHGLEAPKAILGVPGGSNLKRDARYDQILFYPQHTGSVFTGIGGVVDFYAGDHRPLFPDLTREKFTYQMSDHLPLWIQVKTETADEELDQIIRGGE